MSLHLSAEAQRAAVLAYEARRRQVGNGHEDYMHAAVDAALAHDAERLARQIIKQRVSKLNREDGGLLSSAFRDGFDWQEVLLRALTEQP